MGEEKSSRGGAHEEFRAVQLKCCRQTIIYKFFINIWAYGSSVRQETHWHQQTTDIE
jgi:hypothetical protein